MLEAREASRDYLPGERMGSAGRARERNCAGPHPHRILSRALREDAGIAGRVQSLVPLGRIGEAEEVGAISLFLAAPASRYVTGQTIVADGASTIISALNPG